MPATSAPRCASRHSAAEPKPPRPTTTTSLRIASIAADLTRLTSAAGQAGSMIRAAGDGPAKSGCGPGPRLVVCVDMHAFGDPEFFGDLYAHEYDQTDYLDPAPAVEFLAGLA